MIIKRPFPPTASAHPMPPCPLMPAPGVGPHAPRQRLASAGCRRQAAGSHRSARTGRVTGDGQPARLELLGGRLLGVTACVPLVAYAPDSCHRVHGKVATPSTGSLPLRP